MNDLPTDEPIEKSQTEKGNTESERTDIYAPNDELDFIRAGITVLTEHNRSNPAKPQYIHSYHKVENILKENIFFKKSIFTGNGNDVIEVEYQAIYFTVPLIGFLPWIEATYVPPRQGQFTMSQPDHVMSTDLWVVGTIIDNSYDYPRYVPRQSPWFRLQEVALYKKK